MEHVFACVAGFLLDWISDILSQGYTDLQSLVKCLDRRGVASDTVCSQARLRKAGFVAPWCATVNAGRSFWH